MREPGDKWMEWRDAAEFTGWHITRRMLHSVESTMESGWTEGPSTAEECQQGLPHLARDGKNSRGFLDGWLHAQKNRRKEELG